MNKEFDLLYIVLLQRLDTMIFSLMSYYMMSIIASYVWEYLCPQGECNEPIPYLGSAAANFGQCTKVWTS